MIVGVTSLSMPRVLLIADTPWVVNAARAALASADDEIVVVESPEDAVEMTRTIEPDVVLADLQVGSMGGMAIVRALRDAFPQDVRPRLILMLDREPDRFLARRAGADAFLIKPFDASALRFLVGSETVGPHHAPARKSPPPGA
jgi:DNA-binding response OmpR family regulator